MKKMLLLVVCGLALSACSAYHASGNNVFYGTMTGGVESSHRF